ncbi:hypothetical protein K432DRAFT_234021 [Lepidopterella palustris CBS 459.81]|uniref:Uncharacterized protein n=1 Tax=Lepidopterella palustris CBS 459.81 TaxID=1314670 RepID=A0A8E2J8P9_9PEZI|nr:hypothetical protein K432DRAFT_234021 [Lepidopterella palustris CBS 459.81]
MFGRLWTAPSLVAGPRIYSISSHRNFGSTSHHFATSRLRSSARRSTRWRWDIFAVELPSKSILLVGINIPPKIYIYQNTHTQSTYNSGTYVRESLEFLRVAFKHHRSWNFPVVFSAGHWLYFKQSIKRKSKTSLSSNFENCFKTLEGQLNGCV